jgi:hypothetical protein
MESGVTVCRKNAPINVGANQFLSTTCRIIVNTSATTERRNHPSLPPADPPSSFPAPAANARDNVIRLTSVIPEPIPVQKKDRKAVAKSNAMARSQSLSNTLGKR